MIIYAKVRRKRNDPKKRLIDVNEELRKMQAVLDENQEHKDTAAYRSFESVMEGLKKAPTADAVEVVHGRWIEEKWTRTDQHICSLCHSTVRVYPHSVQYKYCPYCGAKMDIERGKHERNEQI